MMSFAFFRGGPKAAAVPAGGTAVGGGNAARRGTQWTTAAFAPRSAPAAARASRDPHLDWEERERLRRGSSCGLTMGACFMPRVTFFGAPPPEPASGTARGGVDVQCAAASPLDPMEQGHPGYSASSCFPSALEALLEEPRRRRRRGRRDRGPGQDTSAEGPAASMPQTAAAAAAPAAASAARSSCTRGGSPAGEGQPSAGTASRFRFRIFSPSPAATPRSSASFGSARSFFSPHSSRRNSGSSTPAAGAMPGGPGAPPTLASRSLYSGSGLLGGRRLWPSRSSPATRAELGTPEARRASAAAAVSRVSADLQADDNSRGSRRFFRAHTDVGASSSAATAVGRISRDLGTGSSSRMGAADAHTTVTPASPRSVVAAALAAPGAPAGSPRALSSQATGASQQQPGSAAARAAAALYAPAPWARRAAARGPTSAAAALAMAEPTVDDSLLLSASLAYPVSVLEEQLSRAEGAAAAPRDLLSPVNGVSLEPNDKPPVLPPKPSPFRRSAPGSRPGVAGGSIRAKPIFRRGTLFSPTHKGNAAASQGSRSPRASAPAASGSNSGPGESLYAPAQQRWSGAQWEGLGSPASGALLQGWPGFFGAGGGRGGKSPGSSPVAAGQGVVASSRGKSLRTGASSPGKESFVQAGPATWRDALAAKARVLSPSFSSRRGAAFATRSTAHFKQAGSPGRASVAAGSGSAAPGPTAPLGMGPLYRPLAATKLGKKVLANPYTQHKDKDGVPSASAAGQALSADEANQGWASAGSPHSLPVPAFLSLPQQLLDLPSRLPWAREAAPPGGLGDLWARLLAGQGWKWSWEEWLLGLGMLAVLVGWLVSLASRGGMGPALPQRAPYGYQSPAGVAWTQKSAKGVPYYLKQARPGVLELSATALQATLRNRRTFVMFYAPWCPYCHRMEAAWTQLATTLAEKGLNVQVARVDAYRYPELAQKYSIPGFPTLMLFDGETPVAVHKGRRDASSLVDFVSKQFPTQR